MSSLDAILEKYTDPSRENPLPLAIAGAATRDKGLVYLGASGVTNVNGGKKVTPETTVAFYSCTKAIATTAFLKMLELGKVKSIDDLVEIYVPEIKNTKIIESMNPDGTPNLKPYKTKPTLRHLLTHTAGFSYTFFSEEYKKILDASGVGNIMTCEWKDFDMPLLFEPGSKWHYGVSIDWIGRVVYNVSGTTLDAVCKEYIFKPIGADSLSFIRSKEQMANQAEIHKREFNTSGALIPLVGIHPEVPEFHAGGFGCWGKVEDYIKFLEIFLHEGKGANGAQVLKPETIKNYSFKDLLPGGVEVGPTLVYSDPVLSNPVTSLDSLPKGKNGWTASFEVVDVDLPTGRKGPHYSWCGLPNLYYWVDPTSGVVGMFATQLFPFWDQTALEGFGEFETAIYKNFVK